VMVVVMVVEVVMVDVVVMVDEVVMVVEEVRVVVVVMADWLGHLFSVTTQGNYITISPQLPMIILPPVTNIIIFVYVDTIYFSIKRMPNCASREV